MGSKVLLSAVLVGRSANVLSLNVPSSTKNLLNPCKKCLLVSVNHLHSANNKLQLVTSATKSKDVSDEEEKSDTISKAMMSYLQRAKEHQDFMDKEEKEFVFGRRHLANMMGKDPETFTQDDINEAIRYLFPSGLFQPNARPIMRPPQEIYPRQKAAQFDTSGRPYHPFFYTATPGFFQTMHEMVGKLQKLNQTAGGLSSIEIQDDLTFAGTVWISKAELEAKFLEKLTDKQFNEWVSCMDTIMRHPSRDREVEFIKQYRKPIIKKSKFEDLPPVTLEPDGRKSCFVGLCMQKSARGEVKVTVPGSGKFNINDGHGLEYFGMMQSRESVIAPLILVGWLGKVDVDAYVTGGFESTEHLKYGGESARAGCIRWGIATGIAALGADAEKLRVGGYLVRDHRQRERNKVGHHGARKKHTWKKR